MESNYEGQLSIISDLIVMNNDRVVGYELAIKETEDLGLKGIFEQFAQQSRENAIVLSDEMKKFGGEPPVGTSTSGKFYRAWMEVKTALTGKDYKAVVSSCEYGEDVILEAYEDAIESETTLPSDLLNLVLAQKTELQDAHDTIKMLRDAKVDA